MDQQNKAEENVEKKPAPFDFTKKLDVVRAYEVSANAALNQSLPIQHITGIQRAASGARQVAELDFRYKVWVEKMRGKGSNEGDLGVPLLQ